MTGTELAPIPVGAALVDVHSEEFRQTATDMARVFEAGIAEYKRLMQGMRETAAGMKAAFPESCLASKFEVGFYYYGRRHSGDYEPDRIFDEMNRGAWSMIADVLNLRSVMSVAKRAEFEKQLEGGNVPPLTEETVMDVITGMVGMAGEFARDAVREVFDILRPGRNQNATKYKTNDVARVGRRVVLKWMVETRYGGGYRGRGYDDNRLAAIDGVFHLLDGHTVLRDGQPPLLKALADTRTGTGETEYFSFRAFKNGNLHLTFKRQDLLDRLNQVGTGETVLPAAPAKKTRKPRRKATN